MANMISCKKSFVLDFKQIQNLKKKLWCFTLSHKVKIAKLKFLEKEYVSTLHHTFWTVQQNLSKALEWQQHSKISTKEAKLYSRLTSRKNSTNF